MKLVFCGTPQFAVPTLNALVVAGYEIALVVSQPDRPAGRARQLTAPPVKLAALAAGLPIAQPETIRNNPEFHTQLEALAPDAIVVVAYGRLIPPWMLALPRLGCINLHASLLPRYRGAAPIQWAVAMGETITGNTTMLLEEGLDTGPILLQQALAIFPHQTAADLFDVLAVGGAPLVVKTLAGLESGTIEPRPQNHAGASFAPLLTREDGRMDFAARTSTELKNHWRGFQPWPGAFTALDGKKLIVHRMEVVDAASLATPVSPASENPLSVKGTGFSPYMNLAEKTRALAPEGGVEAEGGGGFNPRIMPTESKRALAPEGRVSEIPSLSGPATIPPGQIHIEDHRMLVACARNTWLELVEVQLEGKKRLAAAEFLRGIALPANAQLGALTQ
jgi:methionyl-tRNA formyltransferase